MLRPTHQPEDNFWRLSQHLEATLKRPYLQLEVRIIFEKPWFLLPSRFSGSAPQQPRTTKLSIVDTLYKTHSLQGTAYISKLKGE